MAHVLTGLRLLLVAPVALALARPEQFPPLALLAAVLVAIATDYFDGIMARRTDSASDRGRLFDQGWAAPSSRATCPRFYPC